MHATKWQSPHNFSLLRYVNPAVNVEDRVLKQNFEEMISIRSATAVLLRNLSCSLTFEQIPNTVCTNVENRKTKLRDKCPKFKLSEAALKLPTLVRCNELFANQLEEEFAAKTGQVGHFSTFLCSQTVKRFVSIASSVWNRRDNGGGPMRPCQGLKQGTIAVLLINN